MAVKSVAKSFAFVLRNKWFFIAGLAVLALLVVLPAVLKREGLAARAARCGKGKVWNAGKKKCVCAGASEWDGKKCVTCGKGMVWDWGKKPRAGCACLPGTAWNGKWCAPSARTSAPLNRNKDETTADTCNKIWGDSGSANKPVARGFKATNVHATYHTYAPHYETSSLQCADAIWASKYPDWGKRLLKYPWTAFCVNGLSTSQAGMCGKCFRVTNLAPRGGSTVVRAVDHGGGDCRSGTSGGLDLETCAFNVIDTDGSGVRDGRMRVSVEEVECGADATL